MYTKLKAYLVSNQIPVISAVVLTVLSRIIHYLAYRMDFHVVEYIAFENAHISGTGLIDFINNINIWDAGWYNSIVFEPYTALPQPGGQAQWAFFPLLPTIVRVLCRLFNTTNSYVVVFAVNSLALIGLCIVSYKYVLITRNNEKQAFVVSLLLTNGPFAYFSLVFYTEVLFMFFLACCLYFMKTERYVAMGFCGGLMSATRNIGVFFCFALLLYWIQKYYFNYKEQGFSSYFLDSIKDPRLVFGTFLIPMGVFAFMLYLRVHIGDAYAFVHVQRGWHKVTKGLLQELAYHFLRVFPPDYRAVFTVLALLLCLLLIFNRRIEEAFLPLFVIMISGSQTMTSMQRYLWGTYTIVVAGTDCLFDIKKRYRIVIIIAALIYEVLMFLAWINGNEYVY